MNQYLTIDPWNIIEDGFRPENHLVSESIFSIGNGKMGMRGNFEEDYSGPSLQGNYLAGVYYPDKTKVGWWKNGYPEYFAKVLNAVNWIGLSIYVNDQILDLYTCKTLSYRAELNMKEGVFKRIFSVEMPNGNQVEIRTERFYSIVNDDIGTLKYDIKALNFTGEIKVDSILDFTISNQDSNYNERFWSGIKTDVTTDIALVKSKTKKTEFNVVCAVSNEFYFNAKLKKADQYEELVEPLNITQRYTFNVNKGDILSLRKYASTVTSFFQKEKKLNAIAISNLNEAKSIGFEGLKKEHVYVWEGKWKRNDIIIEGDDAAQQAIRYNIFMLNQTYTGSEARLNIGPKGFTGEKYGGTTYWDTEAYCLPFYQCTASDQVAKNLLIYRHNHLAKAIENAEKLGFKDGAALYPMVTMNGEECHNEWEITFEEIHRNGAIAYAIYDYIKYSGDDFHIVEYGFDVLIGITRFWAQRFNYSSDKEKYVMLGVTGPNEYENNVHNNWYTSYIARWCMNYTMEMIGMVKQKYPSHYLNLLDQNNFVINEMDSWKEIVDNVYLPYDEKRDVFLQQDGFLDKELLTVEDIPENENPIVQNWSWDRILRSCFIKQADVLQGLYFFQDDFTLDQIEKNFDFYEPMTVHESSLSPCVHSILASKLGRVEKAYELFLRTSRLDLDDMNNDTEDGCHITSMAGTWLSIVKGFGGMNIKDDLLSLQPVIPKAWTSYTFRIVIRGQRITLKVANDYCEIINDSKVSFDLLLYDKKFEIAPGINRFDNR